MEEIKVVFGVLAALGSIVVLAHSKTATAWNPVHERISVLLRRIGESMRVCGTRPFRAGLVLGILFGMSLNVVPYLLTRQAYHGDGFEVIGFPFVFRRLGGFAGLYEFSIWALLADLAFVAVLSYGLAIGLGQYCRRAEPDAGAEPGPAA